MNRSQMIALFDRDQRIEIEYPDSRREATPNVVRHVNTTGSGEGYVLYTQLTESNADEIIREQVRYFESIGQDFEWKVYDYDRPSDLKERLQTYGFVVEEEEAIMVLDLDHAPDVFWQPVQHTIRQILDPNKLSDVSSVEGQVWNEDFSSLERYLGNALREYPEQMSVYVAYVDSVPASAAWTYFPKHSQFASLWGGSTISSARGRGLYTALLAMRAQEAKARQVSYLTVDASPMSRPILEKFGFERIAYSYPCKWEVKPQTA